MPDYVYFNHSAHVNRGVSCVECHGRVDLMEEVRHAKHFSMTFCLDCHRDPNDRLRPLEKITDLAYDRSKDEKYKDFDFVTKKHDQFASECAKKGQLDRSSNRCYLGDTKRRTGNYVPGQSKKARKK